MLFQEMGFCLYQLISMRKKQYFERLPFIGSKDF